MNDWKKIRSEYLRGGTSYRKLAAKYGVSFSSLRQVAAKEKWTDLRAQKKAKTDTKLIEKLASKDAERLARFDHIADQLLGKMEEGIADGTLTFKAANFKDLASALKDLKEVKNLRHDLDVKEQMARIDKLRKDCEDESEKTREIKVIIDGGLEDYSS